MINLTLNKLKNLSETNSNYNCISTYCFENQQNLLNVPILKPLLIIILSGSKIVGDERKLTCNMGEFIFFTNMQSINMRNIPGHSSYFALLIEFEFSDFYNLSHSIETKKINDYTIGKTSNSLYKCVLQFIDCFEWAPKEIVESRRVEIIKLLITLGYENLVCFPNNKETSKKVIDIFMKKRNKKITIDKICKEIFMSKSTLYRKLKSEGENIQKIKEKVLMGKAIHLLQTTNLPTEHIAEMVGYSSSIRFSQRFKSYFGLTPKELKNTK